MKRLRRMNRWLVILALLLGIALGTAAALLSLSLSSDPKGLSLGGLIAVIVTAILALAFPILVHYREAWIYKVNSMQLRFGTEVPFLDENAFLSTAERQKVEIPVYAMHLTLVGTPSELDRKSAGLTLAQAVAEKAPKNWDIGYTELGDLLFIGPANEEEFLSLCRDVDQLLAQDRDVPPYCLLLGESSDGKDAYEKSNQALVATLLDQLTRGNLSLQKYYEEEPILAKLDLEYEREQGRLDYFLAPFGAGEDESLELALLVPALYDPYRGQMSDKDLYHAVELSSSRLALDLDSAKEAAHVLSAHPNIQNLAFRIGPETLLAPRFLADLSAGLEAVGVETKRLSLFLFSPSLSDSSFLPFVEKAKGLGFGIGVYEYGGESLERLGQINPEYAFIKPELLRKSASEETLKRLLLALKGFGVKPLLEPGEKLCEYSALPGQARVRLPRKEEEA